jgi:type I site-specific restriction-modification system R (restriction) subunit
VAQINVEEAKGARLMQDLQRIVEDATAPEIVQRHSDEALAEAKKHVNHANPKIRSRAKYIIDLYAKHEKQERAKHRMEIVLYNREGQLVRRRTCCVDDFEFFEMQGYEKAEKPKPKAPVKKATKPVVEEGAE